MIMRKILYYPTISIPIDWIRSTILYWDQVSSIMPKAWEDMLEDSHMIRLAPDSTPIYQEDIEAYEMMKYLNGEGEYIPTRPNEKYVLIREEFENAINFMYPRYSTYDINEHKGLIKNNISKHGNIHFTWNKTISRRNILYDRQLGRIYKDKMSEQIFAFLKNKNLAVEDEVDSECYLVEGHTMLLYMALLAKYLALTDQDYTVIGTDWIRHEELIFENDCGQNSFPSLSATFKDILPVPENDVNIENILKFKKKRKDELYHFRIILDQIEKEIAEAKNGRELKHLLVKFRENIYLEVSNLRKQMKEEDIKTKSSIVKSLIDIKKPELWDSLVRLVGGSVTGTLPALGAASAIQVGYALINRKNEEIVKGIQSPYAYLYYAEKERINQIL